MRTDRAKDKGMMIAVLVTLVGFAILFSGAYDFVISAVMSIK